MLFLVEMFTDVEAETRALVATRASFLAELSLKSPSKLFISLSKRIFSGSKYVTNILFKVENRRTGCGTRYALL